MVEYKNGNFIVDGVAYEREEMLVAAILDKLGDLKNCVDKETLERLCTAIIHTLNNNTTEITNVVNSGAGELTGAIATASHHNSGWLASINSNIDRVIEEMQDQSTVIGDEWMEKILTDYNILKEEYEALEHRDDEKDKIIRALMKKIEELNKQLAEQKKKYDNDTKALKEQLNKEIKSNREKIEEIAKLKAYIKRLEKIVKEEGREELLREIERVKKENARLDNELYQTKQQLCCARSNGWNSAMSLQRSVCC